MGYWLGGISLFLNGTLAVACACLDWPFLAAAHALFAALAVVLLAILRSEDRPPDWVRDAMTRPFEVDQALADRVNACLRVDGKPAAFTVEDFRQGPSGGR